MRSTSAVRTFLATAFMVSIAAAAASAQGRIEVVGGDTFNWGAVAPGELKTTITVRNAGNEVVNISHVKPGCGCTNSPIDRNRLEPGESGRVNVTLHAKGSGPITKIITIHSDAPGDTAHVVYLKADLKARITFEPADYFLASGATAGTRQESSLTIVNSGAEPLTIYPPELVESNSGVELSMNKPVEIAPGGKLVLRAGITPLAAGPITGEVKVRTSAAETPELRLRIHGIAAEAPAVAPTVGKKAPSISKRSRR